MVTRKILAACVASLALGSCSTITHTSRTSAVDTRIYNLTVADMKVAPKRDSVTVDWKWNPLSTVSLKAQKESATHALMNKSDADVIVEPQYIVNRRGIFRGGTVTVTGYPATYTDFRPMTVEDAEKIAAVNGDCNTVFVNPRVCTTALQTFKPKRKAVTSDSGVRRENPRYHFVNVLGGFTWEVNNDVDLGGHAGVMYGSYGSQWGWYVKLALNWADCYDSRDYDYSKKYTPTVTVGGIKTIGYGFSAFAGIGLGGYFAEKEEYDNFRYDWKEGPNFSIPVEVGFIKRFGHVNAMLGATYATPLSEGSGNFNPFVGIGYSF